MYCGCLVSAATFSPVQPARFAKLEIIGANASSLGLYLIMC